MKKYVYLTPEQKFQIIQEYTNTNIGLKNLYEKYNVSESTILKILKDVPKKGHYLTKINENYFENIDTSDKAYFLGFITGDGHIKTEKYRTTLQIGAIKSTDVEILHLFNKYTQSDYNISYTKSYKNNTCSELSVLHISNQNFTKKLISQGVTQSKSKNIDFPKHIPEYLMPDYIRGLIDSDGGWHYVGKNNSSISLFFCSSVKNFIEEFQNFLFSKLELNKPKIVNIHKKSKCFSIKYYGNLKCLKLYNYLYNNEEVPFLKRKHKRISLHLQKHNLIPKTNRYDNDTTLYHPGSIKLG